MQFQKHFRIALLFPGKLLDLKRLHFLPGRGSSHLRRGGKEEEVSAAGYIGQSVCAGGVIIKGGAA
jgi:hypothetical protein